MEEKRGVRFSNPAMLSNPNGYSHVAEVTGGKIVYIAGQVALDREGQQVGQDDFAVQVRQVFANLNEALKSAGGSFADVIKLNYYCVDRVERSQLAAGTGDSRSVRQYAVSAGEHVPVRERPGTA